MIKENDKNKIEIINKLENYIYKYNARYKKAMEGKRLEKLENMELNISEVDYILNYLKEN